MTYTPRPQLRSLLEPVAVAVRQLGLTDESAMDVFGQALAEAAREEESHA